MGWDGLVGDAAVGNEFSPSFPWAVGMGLCEAMMVALCNCGNFCLGVG